MLLIAARSPSRIVSGSSGFDPVGPRDLALSHAMDPIFAGGAETMTMTGSISIICLCACPSGRRYCSDIDWGRASLSWTSCRDICALARRALKE